MTGVLWELNERPPGLHPDPTGDIFGFPPSRTQRFRKPKDFKLDTISERPGLSSKPQKQDASTSTTDLNAGSVREGDIEITPKKVHKGQINTLAKLLSTLRR
jgi:hypothetical protein